MKRFYHLLFLFIILTSLSQAQDNPVYSIMDSVYSKVLKEQRMNMENYPDNWIVYDSLGDYYKEKGEKEKAITPYTKAKLKEMNIGK